MFYAIDRFCYVIRRRVGVAGNRGLGVEGRTGGSVVMGFKGGVMGFEIPVLVLDVLLLVPSTLKCLRAEVGCSMLACLPSGVRAVGKRSVLMGSFNANTFSVFVISKVRSGSMSGLGRGVRGMSRMGRIV